MNSAIPGGGTIDETARVFCGIRGKDVDIEICLGCRHLENYDLDSRRPYLVYKGAEEAKLARVAAEA